MLVRMAVIITSFPEFLLYAVLIALLSEVPPPTKPPINKVWQNQYGVSLEDQIIRSLEHTQALHSQLGTLSIITIYPQQVDPSMKG